MKLPPKPILIRLCIYIPLLLFFGWRAYQKWRAEQEPPAAPVFDGPRQTFTLPDGKTIEVVEITEEQARQLGLDPAELEREPKKPATEDGAAKASPEAGAGEANPEAGAGEANPEAGAAKSPAAAAEGAN
ncbi:MAG TPA: hypothetical protein VIK91_08810 [Nannocystis sp.]